MHGYIFAYGGLFYVARPLIHGKAEWSHVYVPDQGYGRGDPPIFSTGIEPLARVTQHLTDMNALGDFGGWQRSKITIPLRIDFAKL